MCYVSFKCGDAVAVFGAQDKFPCVDNTVYLNLTEPEHESDFTDHMKRGASGVEPGLYSPRLHEHEQKTEHNGGFGFQTKVKDHFLHQRR